MRGKRVLGFLIAVLYALFPIFTWIAVFYGFLFHIFLFLLSATILVCVPHWIHYFWGIRFAKKYDRYERFVKIVTIIRIVGFVLALAYLNISWSIDFETFFQTFSLCAFYLCLSLLPQIVHIVKEKTFPFHKSWIITLICGTIVCALLSLLCYSHVYDSIQARKDLANSIPAPQHSIQLCISAPFPSGD